MMATEDRITLKRNFIFVILLAALLKTYGEHIGCYKENRRRPDFYQNPGAIQSGTLTPQQCFTLCGGLNYLYAGLRSGMFCFCSDINNLTSEAKCTLPCPGDPSQTCGSQTHIDVWRALKPIKATLDVAPQNVAARENGVTLTPTVYSDVQYKLSVDFADYAGRTEYSTNGTGLLYRNYAQAGEYNILMYARDTDNLMTDVVTASAVQVSVRPKGITFMCPTDMATFENYTCIISVSHGTGMEVNVQYSGNPSAPNSTTFYIADAMEFSLGNYVQEHLLTPANYTSTTCINGLVVHTGYPGKYNGTLIGFEYNTINAGTLKIYIYRPSCPNSTYCYETNTCDATCGTCSGTSYCSDIKSCCGGPPLRNTIAPVTYNLIHTVSNFVAGHGVYLDTNNINILPGDVIAHDGVNLPLLAQTPSGTNLGDHYCAGLVGPPSFSYTSCTQTTEAHHLKAIYALPSQIMLPFRFTQPGDVTLTANVSSLVALSYDTNSTIIHVIEGINATVFDVQACVEKGVVQILRVLPFTGTSPTAFWDFGDSSVNVTTNSNVTTMNHTYNTFGVFLLSLNISNALSWKSNSTLICVQERITGLSVSVAQIVEIGVASTITTNMMTGSNYTCVNNFVYSNGSNFQVTHTAAVGFVMPATWNYTFTIPGNVHLNVTCTNDIGTMSVAAQIRAVERLTGVGLTPPGAIVNESFQILLSWKTGTDVNLTSFFFKNISILSNMTVNQTGKYAISNTFFENSTGSHLIWYTISNAINTIGPIPETFAIEVEMINPDIICVFPSNVRLGQVFVPYAVIPINTIVECTVTMDAGTSVILDFFWGDSNQTLYVGSTIPWAVNNFTFPFTHNYTIAQYYPLRVQARNSFNSLARDFPVMVMTGVDNVVMNNVSAVSFTPPATVSFNFTITSGPVPNAVTCHIEWGDNTFDDILNCDVTGTYNHTYMDKDGDLTLSYTLSNFVSTKSGTLPVYIVTPIVNNECFTDPVAGIPNVVLHLVFKTWRGPPAGVLDLTFDCDTNVPGTLPTRKRTNQSPNGLDMENCIYPSNGSYTSLITATSRLETKPCTHVVQILNPVEDKFMIYTVNAPIDYEVSKTCNMEYQLNYNGTPIPDNAWIEFDYGDGNKSAPMQFVTVLGLVYPYATHGHYTTTVRIYNLASEVIKKIPSGCYARILDTSIIVLREPLIPVGETSDQPGYGFNFTKFRSDEHLKIHTTMNTGTFVWWEISAVNPTDIFTCNSTTKDIISFDIPKSGIYNITVTAKNPLYTGPPQAYTVEIMHAVENITITDYGIITKAYQDKVFTVSMDSYGSAMCVMADFGDPIAGTIIELYGDTTTCSESTLRFPGVSTQYQYPPDVSSSFNLTHQYLREGSYNIIIYAWNIFSNVTQKFQFAVSSISCTAPNIDIKQRRRNFRYPLEFIRSQRIKIIGSTDITCPDTLKNTKLWTVFKWDARNNVKIADIDITNISSRINSELSFEPLHLEYGLYLLTYKVTMLTVDVSGAQFSSSADTFIAVKKSDVVVQLFENSMSLKSVGPAVILTLSPRSYSYDPDIAIRQQDIFTYFKMACRDLTLNETFVDQQVTAVNLSSLGMQHVDTGGCFRQGPGWIQNFNGSITFNTSILKPNHVYEFLVNGLKDTRNGSFVGQIEVMSADPPEFSIEFKIPSICIPSKSGKLFNPNAQLGLVAPLISTCSSCSYSYRWRMYAYDYQYCGIMYHCWRELAYLSRFIDGTESQELTIHAEVFSHYLDVNDFQIRLRVTNNMSGISGNAILNLTRNAPPTGGNCTISPTSGIAAESNFTIECLGFMDDNDIVEYKVKCRSNERDVDVVSGPQNVWVDTLLPVGDVNDNYVLMCTVYVTDGLGAIGAYAIHNVTVNALPVTDMRNMLLKMLNSSKDISDRIDAIANLDETASYASAIVAMLGVMSMQDEFSDFDGMGTILSYASTRLDKNNIRPGAFTKIVENATTMEMYEEVRDAGAHLVSSLVSTLSKCTVESPSEISRQAAAIAALSSSVAHLTRDTQSNMTDLLERGVTSMRKNMQFLTVESIEDISKSTFEACSNIQQAAVLIADLPTKTDLNTQNDNVPYFDTNLDSSIPDVAASLTDKEVLLNGKEILNKVEQNVFTSSNLGRCIGLEDSLVQIMSDVKPKSPVATILKTGSVEVAVTKNDAFSLVNQTITNSGGKVDLPPDIFSNGGSNDTLVLTVSAKASAGAPLEENGPVGKYSRELSISFTYPNGSRRSVENLTNPIQLTIKQDPNRIRFNDSDLPYVNPEIVATRADEYLFYHLVKVHNARAALLLKFRPTNITKYNQLLVLVNFNELPDLTMDRGKLQHICMIPNNTHHFGFYGDTFSPDPYSCFVDADIIGNKVGNWRIGVRQMLRSELNRYNGIRDLPLLAPDIWKQNKSFEQNYIFSPVEITCACKPDGSSTYSVDGVKPSRFSTDSAIQCETTHLTTFAGNWAVAPNTIDWNFVFSHADFFKNPTLYITEIVVAIAYVFAMIWARHKDKQDIEKLGLAPLLDNDPRDKYYYEIIVSTGMRRGAGTESKVHFIISGEEEESEVRTFSDTKRKIFQRGNTDGFLMAVPEPLGALTYLRIWHDNSGKGQYASWYLNHVIVRDIQTDRKYYFIADKWFAVEEDDGQVDRVIPVAGREQRTEFAHLFSEKATKNLSDEHLWFSVIARPPNSRFTRCQRVSCCLCLLFTSMLANAMFYETATSDAEAFQIGPFAVTGEQVYIGIISNLIIFPVNFILITLFRKSRPRKLRPSRIEKALEYIPERSASVTDINPRVKSALGFDHPASSFLFDSKRSVSAMSRPVSSLSTRHLIPKTKKSKCECPWWFTIISWILLWLAVLVSAAFVTFYGIMFQDIKCKKWITSMLISFFTSVFLTQPIKVFLFAIIFSLIIKNPSGDDDEDEDEEPNKMLENDEEYLYKDDDEFNLIAPQRAKYKPKPPSTKVLEAARQERLKEIQMWAVIREIVLYGFFLWILLVISYRNVNTDSYNYKANMERLFITTTNTGKAFKDIKSTGSFWTWAKTGMLRGLRAGPYYNNFPPFYLRGYIDDKQSRLMGYATLRQVRIRPDECKVPKVMESVIGECNSEYQMGLDESSDFGPGWNSLSYNNTREEYIYQSASSLNGYPYWGQMALYEGGGYVKYLNKDYFTMSNELDNLIRENWIDKYTRAVFVEFTVYNPSVNMFAISTLLAEFMPNGGVLTSYRFEPCILLPYMSSLLLFQIACEVMYFGFTVFFIVKLIRDLVKQKSAYFFQFWNLVELGICAMSITAIVIYFYRLFCINALTSYFKRTSGNSYMKFQYVGYWSELFNYIIGWLVFFSTLKFLKLLRFNKKISLLSDTLRNSSKQLIHFSIIFNLVFLAFIQLFYLVYMAHLDTFRSFIIACESGLVMMMGKFDIYSMLGVNQWLTQILVFLFVVTITFIVVNMLLSILNDTFSAVRHDVTKQKNDYEIIDFMLGRFKLWTGIGHSGITISPADMEKERNKDFRSTEEQIEDFPDQMDRFLASISHMYIGDTKFDDFLHRGMYQKMATKAQMPPFLHQAPCHRFTQRISSGMRNMTDVQTD